jgi:hypothetical protein
MRFPLSNLGVSASLSVGVLLFPADSTRFHDLRRAGNLYASRLARDFGDHILNLGVSASLRLGVLLFPADSTRFHDLRRAGNLCLSRFGRDLGDHIEVLA